VYLLEIVGDAVEIQHVLLLYTTCKMTA